MTLKDWLSIGMTVLNFAFVVFVWLQSRKAASKAELAARDAHVDAEIAQLKTEVALAKQGLCNAPGDEDLAKVYDRINEVNTGLGEQITAAHGEIRHVCGVVNGMSRTLDNINTYLIQRGDR